MSQAFSGQRKGEKFLFLFRRSLISTRKGFFLCLVLVAIAATLVIFWPTNSNIWITSSAAAVLGLAILIYYLILQHFTVYIVSSERIRQILQKGFFKRTVLDLDLDKIQSITYDIPGFSGTVFGYGTIVIQTIAGDLTISAVARPEKVYNKLQDAINLVKRRQSEEAI